MTQYDTVGLMRIWIARSDELAGRITAGERRTLVRLEKLRAVCHERVRRGVRATA